MPTRSPTGLRPPAKSLADCLAIGVGPVLIMLLVGSLVFFLVQVGYRGAFSPHVHWTLFWFTVASVLVSRISIENGSAYGSLYGLALGAATAFHMVQFLGAPYGALLLLGLIWWCTSKLTWDCTVIDEEEDASGAGLLQHAGMGGGKVVGKEESGEPPPAAPRPGDAPFDEPRAARRPHAPGLWVLYFSIGALPVFGFGQWAIPADHRAARLWGFTLSAVFVASALALLLTSSFLGLRRYLRQRQLVMPSPMARAWILSGTGLLLAVMLGALLLPRPRGLDTLAGLGLGLESPPQTASRWAMTRGEAAEGEGRLIGRARDGSRGPGREQEDRASEGGERSEEGAHPGTSERQGDSSETGTAQVESGASGGSQAGAGSGATPPSAGALPAVMSPATSLPAVLRVLSLLAGVALVGFLLLRYGRSWLAALREAWRDRPRPGPAKSVPAGPVRPAFLSFQDPFASGRAGGMTTVELTTYTFDALEAWAADAGRARRPDETPGEFGRNLAAFVPDLAEDLLGTVRLYAGVAYGGVVPSTESMEVLRRLWSGLASGPAS